MGQKREQDGEQSMNEGPFRMPNSADRGSSRPAAPASHPEPAPEEPKEPEQPKPVHHRTVAPSRRTVKEEVSKKPFLLAGVIVAVVIVVGLIVWAFVPKADNTTPPIDSSKYQAVFFTNGQVYFGKLQPVNGDYLKLTDIYYLQTQQSDTSSKNPQQQTTADQNSAQLIKLGSEIHGPEDEMVIAKNQVLFYENLKPDGKVATSIAQYKKSH